MIKCVNWVKLQRLATPMEKQYIVSIYIIPNTTAIFILLIHKTEYLEKHRVPFATSMEVFMKTMPKPAI